MCWRRSGARLPSPSRRRSATWIVCALAIRAITWSVPGAILLNVAAYGVCVPLAQRYLHVRMPVITRRWFDIPLRASLVAVLVGIVVTLGDSVGPVLAGIFAVFPIVMLSIMLILHPRIGGVATAAIIANAMWGLVGFALAILTLHLAAVPFGAPLALASALAVSVVCNIAHFHAPPRRPCGAHGRAQFRGFARSLRA